jgi:hypothetical protein
MPPPDPGRWEAVIWRTTLFSRHGVKGRRRSYLLARLQALYKDIRTSYYDGNLELTGKLGV